MVAILRVDGTSFVFNADNVRLILTQGDPEAFRRHPSSARRAVSTIRVSSPWWAPRQ